MPERTAAEQGERLSTTQTGRSVELLATERVEVGQEARLSSPLRCPRLAVLEVEPVTTMIRLEVTAEQEDPQERTTELPLPTLWMPFFLEVREAAAEDLMRQATAATEGPEPSPAVAVEEAEHRPVELEARVATELRVPST
jgi:hypothetical protein